MRALVFLGELAIGAAGLAGLITRAQSPSATSPPSFEVASIKPQPWIGQGSVGVFDIAGNTLSVEHVDVYTLVEFAYGLRTDDIQLSGGPSWAHAAALSNSSLYQVIARAAGDPPPSRDQFRLMMQTLLADRFQLKIHHVSKDLPVFDLVVSRNGPKLTKNTGDAKFSMNVRGGRISRITAVHASMANLIGRISGATGRPVFDTTGLTGFYDFEIEWSAEGIAAAGPDSAAPDSGPSVFTASGTAWAETGAGHSPV